MIINQGENTLQAANFVPPSVLNSNLKAINRKMMKLCLCPDVEALIRNITVAKFLFFWLETEAMDERVFFTEEEDTQKQESFLSTYFEREGGQKKLMRKVPCGGFFFPPEMMNFLSHNIEGSEGDCNDILKVVQTRFLKSCVKM